MAAISISLNTAQLRAAMARVAPWKLWAVGNAAMNESVGYLQGEVQQATPINTGVARASIFTEVYGLTLSSLRGRVASPEEYMVVLERGRRPNQTMPPVVDIQMWAERKLGDGSWNTAFVIARAIGRRGLPPHRMFENAATKGKMVVERIFLGWFGRL